MIISAILEAYYNKGYKFRYENYPNIFGIRTDLRITDKFDDIIGVFWGEKYIDNIVTYSATTDPGKFYTQNPMDGKRTAIMCPGQHKNVYAKGLHQGKYEALKQVREIPFYQDVNKDLIIDTESIKSQLIGANIHGTKDDFKPWRIGKFSAGCQVIEMWDDYMEFMNIIKNSIYKEFDYTLFNKKDMWLTKTKSYFYMFNKISYEN